MAESSFNITTTTDMNEIVGNCQLIVTCTSSEVPLIDRVNKGTHITAMGSDTLNKHELAPSILLKADLIVADSRSQCQVRGEIYPAMADWLLTTLNEGRSDNYERTIYIEDGTTLGNYEHG